MRQLTTRRYKPDHIPNLLDQNDVREILIKLNISWPEHKVNHKGWVVICSPLRADKNPSFSLNVREGCFIDFSRPEIKGGIIDLVSLVLKTSKKRAKRWIIDNSVLKSLNI